MIKIFTSKNPKKCYSSLFTSVPQIKIHQCNLRNALENINKETKDQGIKS